MLTRLPERPDHRCDPRGACLLAGRGGLLAGRRILIFPPVRSTSRWWIRASGRVATSSRSRPTDTCSWRPTTACWRRSSGGPRKPAIHRLDLRRAARFNLPPQRHFHGRDIFAPLAAEMAAGRAQADETSGRSTRTSSRPGSRIRRYRGPGQRRRDHDRPFRQFDHKYRGRVDSAFRAPRRPDWRSQLSAAAHLWRRAARASIWRSSIRSACSRSPGPSRAPPKAWASAAGRPWSSAAQISWNVPAIR